MKTLPKKLILGIILLVIPLVKWGYWILLFNSNSSFAEAKNRFVTTYPSFLQSNWLNNILLVLAVLFLAKTLPKYKILSFLLILLSTVLLFLQFWAMM